MLSQSAPYRGTVFAGGVTRVGDIKGHPALKKAYDMGRSLGE